MSDRNVGQTIWVVTRSVGYALVKFVMFLGAALKASVPGGASPLPPDTWVRPRAGRYPDTGLRILVTDVPEGGI